MYIKITAVIEANAVASPRIFSLILSAVTTSAIPVPQETVRAKNAAVVSKLLRIIVFPWRMLMPDITPDLTLVSLVVAIAVGATGWMQLLINRAKMVSERPFLTIGSVSILNSVVGLVIKNAGGAPAGKISVSVLNEHQTLSVFCIDGVATGGEATLSSVSPQSAWLELSFDYSDLTGRCFQGVRRLEAQGQTAFRIKTASEPRADAPRLFGPLRIKALS